MSVLPALTDLNFHQYFIVMRIQIQTNYGCVHFLHCGNIYMYNTNITKGIHDIEVNHVDEIEKDAIHLVLNLLI